MAVYILKINFALMLLYGFYRAMMARDTFFGYRRAALLAIIGMSIAVPMMNIQPILQHNATAIDMATVYADFMLPVVPVYASGPSFTWVDAVKYLYIIGVCIFALRFLFQLGSILHQAYTTPVVETEGIKVHKLCANHSPFSFFGWIFVCPEALSPDRLHEVLVHEQTHVRQYHSLDVLLSELFCVFNWFNPFCYLMKREIRLNLEYLADEAVLDEGNARKSYQYHLLGLAYHPARRDLTNNFNVLPLKNRIKMMNKRRTKEIEKAKYLLFIPLAAGLLAVSNIEMIAHTINANVPAIAKLSEPADPMVNDAVSAKESTPTPKFVTKTNDMTAIQTEAVTKTDQDGKKVYAISEEMPTFPGGTSAMMKYLASNIKYPKECHEKGIQGRVIVQFIVQKDGSISNVKVVRSIDPLLDAEAVRVVSGMPKWTPGKMKGKPVNVHYTIPISFQLSGDKETTETKKEVIIKSGEAYILVDGVEKTKAEMKALSPDKIESVDVLKGDAAIAKYGEKAQHGAILITTKK
ncbi:MAG: TonB family protein [Prevotella sp.]|jgi:TonB family protein